MILRVIFGAIAFCFSMYALITNKYQVIPYMLFFLGLMGLVTGISELKVERRTSAIITFLTSAFALFVCFYTFNTFN